MVETRGTTPGTGVVAVPRGFAWSASLLNAGVSFACGTLIIVTYHELAIAPRFSDAQLAAYQVFLTMELPVLYAAGIVWGWLYARPVEQGNVGRALEFPLGIGWRLFALWCLSDLAALATMAFRAPFVEAGLWLHFAAAPLIAGAYSSAVSVFVQEWLVARWALRRLPSTASLPDSRGALRVATRQRLLYVAGGLVPVLLVTVVTVVHFGRVGVPVPNSLYFAVAALASVGFTLARAAGRTIRRPLEALSRAAERVRDGDLDVRLDVLAGDELGQVSGAFNSMVEGLRERERLRAQMNRQQRLAVLGQLAGGVAHDFNNLLCVISSNTQFAADSLTEQHPAREDLAEVLRVVERAAGLTRQLLTFSRREVAEPRVVDLGSALAETEKMLRRLIGENIEFRIEPAADLWRVRIDPVHLEQILANLVVNARDAMPEGGVLTVATANVPVDEAYAREHTEIEPGRWVRLSVRDTGCGMPEAVRARIFEPFFTTKEGGRGTGLGLSTVYGIVEQSGGRICVHSEPARGSCFEVHLAAVDLPAEVARSGTSEAPRGAGETILVVEDDPALRRAVVRILAGGGYETLEACDGQEAFTVWQRQRQCIDLVVTDLLLPGLSGLDLGHRIRTEQPTIPVLLISGSLEAAPTAELDGPHVLSKPFTTEALLTRVHEMLDSSGRLSPD